MSRAGRLTAPVGRRRRRLAGALAGAGLAAVSVAGCGIPTDSNPKAIAKSDVPFHLLNPTPTTSTTLAPTAVTEEVFLVDQSLHLVAVHRDVPLPASLSQVLTALLAGPSATESAEGIQSFLTGNATQASSGSNRVVATVVKGVATVDFPTNPVQVVGVTETLLAIAQVVFTATSQPGVTSVLFQIAGEPIEVPTPPIGALVPGPVTQAQYQAQAPLSPAVEP